MEMAKGETIEERWRAKAREGAYPRRNEFILVWPFHRYRLVHARRGFRNGRRNKGYFNCGGLNHRQLPLKLHDTYRPAEILHAAASIISQPCCLALSHCESSIMPADSSRLSAQELSLPRCTQVWPIGHGARFIRKGRMAVVSKVRYSSTRFVPSYYLHFSEMDI